jgi:hypothetical protein
MLLGDAGNASAMIDHQIENTRFMEAGTITRLSQLDCEAHSTG